MVNNFKLAIGALVVSRTSKGEGSLKIEIDLPVGLYIFKIGDDAQSLVKKIHVIRIILFTNLLF